MTDSSILAVAEPPAENPPARAPSETFCVRLWQHMRLEASGEARVCCDYTRGCIEQDGVPASTDRQTLMQIWNADTMRELRRDMVAGRRVAGCEACYTAEARGGVSTRLSDNMAWQQAGSHEPRATFEAMVAQAVDNDFRLPKLPAIIEVEADNLCNFKCRMCNTHSSSLIARDPVHSKWNAGSDAPDQFQRDESDPGRIRRVWPITNLADELAKDTGSEVVRLNFLGGEPFLLPEIPTLLERLIAADRARLLSLIFVSNGSVVPEWLSLAENFRRVDVAVSVDGYANDFEYIRYPGRWSKLTQNLQVFRTIPGVTLSVTTTIQANNVLGITRLFRYLDAVEIPFTGHVLYYPGYHAVSALPPSIRHLAAARLREYAEDDCRPDNRPHILSFAAQIEAADAPGNPALLRDFMLFTNDIDATRGQSIHHTDPELVALLEQAGYPWTRERLHAPPDAPVQQAPSRRLAPIDAFNANTTLQRELAVTVKSLRDELMHERNGLRMTEEQATIREDEARLRDEATRIRDQAAHIRDEAARIRDEEARIRDQAAHIRDQATRIRDEEARIRDQEAARVRLELAKVHLAFDQLRLAFDQIHREFDRLHASRSWRLTRPLRAVGRMLRRWLPGRAGPGDVRPVSTP